MKKNKAWGGGGTYSKGFTLIELLAVIVILAIIALIATPIVLDIIDDSKDSSIKRSIELYGKAVENSVAKAQLNGNTVPSGKYITIDGKTLTNGNTTIKVDYNGAKTVCEVYISNEGTVSLKRCNVNNQDIEYTYGDKIYDNGEVVYFDVTTGKSCNTYTEENSNTNYNGINGTGNQNGCLKFYAFNDFGNDKLNLILDHNVVAITAFREGDGGTDNLIGPSNIFLKSLKVKTDTWKGTETPTNYSIDLGEGKAQYQVDYSEYKARIITAGEVAIITNNTSWNELTSTTGFYLDSNEVTPSDTCYYNETTGINDISGCKYGWLYDRTKPNCTKYGCLNNSDIETYGYWTISPSSDIIRTYSVEYKSCLTAGLVDQAHGAAGIRPVIEILRSNLE